MIYKVETPEQLRKKLGFITGTTHADPVEEQKVTQYLNLKLSALGQPAYKKIQESDLLELSRALLLNFQEKNRLLSEYLCPTDNRIQSYLDKFLADVKSPGLDIPKLPFKAMILDRHGLARHLSLPPDQDFFFSDLIQSYRIPQGILHNPVNDRRTTKGTFHVVQGGFPIADDKIAVSKTAFLNLLQHALTPPDELLTLPFTSTQEEKAKLFVSLLIKPMVVPEVPSHTNGKYMEIRFFAPGSLVSNLDFVESIFGNAGDPFLPEIDSSLDVFNWTGLTGCVILAPHLTKLTKKQLGLVPIERATEREKRDGQCYRQDDELYNEGVPFKVTCRDKHGVVVTIIADNYFGYCKKEVKTMLSYATNMYGLAEEEHSGSALTFPSYNLGEEFELKEEFYSQEQTWDRMIRRFGDKLHLQNEGYGIDRHYEDIMYVPETARFILKDQKVIWHDGKETHSIPLSPQFTYIYPNGYRVIMDQNPKSLVWRLRGISAESTFCHKPCTVSGGGKSEISKSIQDAVVQGPMLSINFPEDIKKIREIIEKDYSSRFIDIQDRSRISRPVLSEKRSLGSVIKLLTPSDEFTDEYNLWLKELPNYIKEIIFLIKWSYKPEMKDDWDKLFSVDSINGNLGFELKYKGQKVNANYLRVGLEKNNSWRVFKLRYDFLSAEKLQMGDDISVSIVLPGADLNALSGCKTSTGESFNPNLSYKFTSNCEYRLFQRPDDAIHRGQDNKAELDLASYPRFVSNFAPLTHNECKAIAQDVIGFEKYTLPMRSLISQFLEEKSSDYCVVSSHPRMVDGAPSKNPRYLEDRMELMNPRKFYLAETCSRLNQIIEPGKPVLFPVNLVLPGRRNNPPDAKTGIRALAVYNPIHYQELPELFMDFICSLTGKSPSTTGAGSEGALTKGPFNNLLPVVDLNYALVSYILTGFNGFSSAAGYVGPDFKVDHDISLLVPEVFCRMSDEERTPAFLMEHGLLEKLEDFTHEGKQILASRLGYRITDKFVYRFFGRIFNNPHVVFSDNVLKPELQSMESFIDGIDNIVSAQQRVALHYFNDSSVEQACPPLKALLHIMAEGHFEGKSEKSPEIRAMFKRETVINSEWYLKRLCTKQKNDQILWNRHIDSLKSFLKRKSHEDEAQRLDISGHLSKAESYLEFVSSEKYLKQLHGTLGADPSLCW